MIFPSIIYILHRLLLHLVTPSVVFSPNLEGIKIILNNNSFQFNNINYIQTLWTAMGTKMAPKYPNLTLIYFEENLYEIIGKNTAAT